MHPSNKYEIVNNLHMEGPKGLNPEVMFLGALVELVLEHKHPSNKYEIVNNLHVEGPNGLNPEVMFLGGDDAETNRYSKSYPSELHYPFSKSINSFSKSINFESIILYFVLCLKM